MTITHLNVKNIIKSTRANTYEKGQLLFQNILQYVEKNENVSLDFSEVSKLSTAFCNRSIGSFYFNDKLKKYTNLIEIDPKSISSYQKDKVERAINNARNKAGNILSEED